jgi:hypothetical protein
MKVAGADLVGHSTSFTAVGASGWMVAHSAKQFHSFVAF